MQVRIGPCHCLGNQHLYHADHAAPSHVFALIGKSSIGKPNDLLKGIKKLLFVGEIIMFAKHVGIITGLPEVERHSR